MDTELKVKLLKSLIGGADILSYTKAKQLRELQKKSPELINITKVMGDYKVTESYPYFGAIPTEEGLDFIECH